MARVIRVAVSELAEGERTLDEAASRYLVRVHRAESGTRFVVFDPAAKVEADATLLSANAREARCRLGAPRPASALPRARITLLQGVGKGDKIDQVVRDATALGAERIVVVTTARAVPRLAERAQARAARWRQIAVDAARQSGRGDVPQVTPPQPLVVALEQAPAGRRIVLEPGAALPLARALADWSANEPLTALIGPEGGLDESEISAASAAGFSPVRFGPFVLRTQTAATALLGALVALAEPRQ